MQLIRKIPLWVTNVIWPAMPENTLSAVRTPAFSSFLELERHGVFLVVLTLTQIISFSLILSFFSCMYVRVCVRQNGDESKTEKGKLDSYACSEHISLLGHPKKKVEWMIWISIRQRQVSSHTHQNYAFSVVNKIKGTTERQRRKQKTFINGIWWSLKGFGNSVFLFFYLYLNTRSFFDITNAFRNIKEQWQQIRFMGYKVRESTEKLKVK